MTIKFLQLRPLAFGVAIIIIGIIISALVSRRGRSHWRVDASGTGNQSATRVFLDTLKTNRSSFEGQAISVPGRVYQDEGGIFWIVNSIGKKPSDEYALQLTAWPFKQSPPSGMWSCYLELSGDFSWGGSEKVADFLIGPYSISIKDPPEGEDYGSTLDDPFYK